MNFKFTHKLLPIRLLSYIVWKSVRREPFCDISPSIMQNAKRELQTITVVITRPPAASDNLSGRVTPRFPI